MPIDWFPDLFPRSQPMYTLPTGITGCCLTTSKVSVKATERARVLDPGIRVWNCGPFCEVTEVYLGYR